MVSWRFVPYDSARGASESIREQEVDGWRLQAAIDPPEGRFLVFVRRESGAALWLATALAALGIVLAGWLSLH